MDLRIEKMPADIAYRMGYITEVELERLAQLLKGSGYGSYLLGLLNEQRC